jgi:hypothetical protein
MTEPMKALITGNIGQQGSYPADALLTKTYEVDGLRGNGSASREVTYVVDAAVGIVMGAERYDSPEPVKLGLCAQISGLPLARGWS